MQFSQQNYICVYYCDTMHIPSQKATVCMNKISKNGTLTARAGPEISWAQDGSQNMGVYSNSCGDVHCHHGFRVSELHLFSHKHNLNYPTWICVIAWGLLPYNNTKKHGRKSLSFITKRIKQVNSKGHTKQLTGTWPSNLPGSTMNARILVCGKQYNETRR
jgi:hypothetical protein